MCDTIIPLTNPAPRDGKTDMRGHLQTMVYLLDHPDTYLAGKAKGMAIVIKEWWSVYNWLGNEVGSKKKVVGKCGQYWKLAMKKDTECCITLVKMAGQEDTLDDTILEEASEVVEEPKHKWCCLYRILLLQEYFINEKPKIQHY